MHNSIGNTCDSHNDLLDSVCSVQDTAPDEDDIGLRDPQHSLVFELPNSCDAVLIGASLLSEAERAEGAVFDRSTQFSQQGILDGSDAVPCSSHSSAEDTAFPPAAHVSVSGDPRATGSAASRSISDTVADEAVLRERQNRIFGGASPVDRDQEHP